MKWTQREETELIYQVEINWCYEWPGWNQISSHVGRSPESCRKKYKKMIDSREGKGIKKFIKQAFCYSR